MGKVTWYVARSAGLVAWALVLVTIVWGMLLATRVLGRRPTPAWLLSLHRFLGGLAFALLGVHVAAVLLDDYVDFSVVNVLVPFTGSWRPAAVAWGIVAMYLLVAIEVTSLVRHGLSRKIWHAVHLLSYLVFATATVHMVTAGTDVAAVIAAGSGVLVSTMAVFGSAAVYLWRTSPAARVRPAMTRQPNRQPPRNTDATTTNAAAALRP